jgi:hypothetical protein
MDCATGVLFKGQRLHDHVVTCPWLLNVNQPVRPVVHSEGVWITKLADFAFKVLPEKGCIIVSLPLLQLYLKPTLQTLVVNKANTA